MSESLKVQPTSWRDPEAFEKLFFKLQHFSHVFELLQVCSETRLGVCK